MFLCSCVQFLFIILRYSFRGEALLAWISWFLSANRIRLSLEVVKVLYITQLKLISDFDNLTNMSRQSKDKGLMQLTSSKCSKNVLRCLCFLNMTINISVENKITNIHYKLSTGHFFLLQERHRSIQRVPCARAGKYVLIPGVGHMKWLSLLGGRAFAYPVTPESLNHSGIGLSWLHWKDCKWSSLKMAKKYYPKLSLE